MDKRERLVELIMDDPTPALLEEIGINVLDMLDEVLEDDDLVIDIYYEHVGDPYETLREELRSLDAQTIIDIVRKYGEEELYAAVEAEVEEMDEDEVQRLLSRVTARAFKR